MYLLIRRIAQYFLICVNGGLIALLIASFEPIWTLKVSNEIEGLAYEHSLWFVLEQVRRPDVYHTFNQEADEDDRYLAAKVFGMGWLCGTLIFAIYAAGRHTQTLGLGAGKSGKGKPATSRFFRRRIWRYVPAVATGVFAGLFAWSLLTVGKTWHPKGTGDVDDEAIVPVAGWMQQSQNAAFIFEHESPRTADALPAYTFRTRFRTAAPLARFQAPDSPFGLDFSRSGMTDEWLKHVSGFKSLEALNLRGTNVSDAGLQHIIGLKRLRWLNLSGTVVKDVGIKQLAQLPELEGIALPFALSGEALKELSGLENLKSLDFTKTSVVDKDLKDVACIKSLKCLDLRITGVTDAGLEHLAGHPNLETLYLWGDNLTDATVKELAALPNLRRLEIGSSLVTEIGLKELAEVAELRMLNLPYVKITEAELKALEGFKNLERLELRSVKLTNAMVKLISGHQTLRELNLSMNADVGDDAMKELAELKNLETLWIFDTNVTDAGLKHLSGLKQLKSLYVMHSRVTDNGVRELQQALPECQITR